MLDGGLGSEEDALNLKGVFKPKFQISGLIDWVDWVGQSFASFSEPHVFMG